MNAFQKMLNLTAAKKKLLGVEFTAREIAQQPPVWLKASRNLKDRQKEVSRFMASAGLTGPAKATLVLTGAGTSEFVGSSTVYGLRNTLGREVMSIPTTHFVTHAAGALVPKQRYVISHFARSGDSPESLATYRFLRKFYPAASHIVISCNRNGALAKAAARDGKALCLFLPDETNDRSLVMTSSFSTMALTALLLPLVGNGKKCEPLVQRISAAASRVVELYGDMLHHAGSSKFTRACFLGSNALFGTMQECHLKMQEMTEGRVVCRFDSFLGLRHGPQVFVNKECMVFASLSSDPYPRQYEMDMLRQLKANGQGCGLVLVCDKATRELRKLTPDIIELFPRGEPVPDIYRVMTDVVAGQMLAFFKCLAVGLKPDNPSTSGTINRVVKGVTIYEP